MKSVSAPICITLLAIAGTALTSLSTASLHQNGKLATDRNPMAIQRSAFGKLLARLSESTIDRVWHMGVEQITPHGTGGCGPDCGHDHAPGETCSHGDSSDTFTFHVDESGNIEEESDHEGHDHDHDAHAHDAHDHGDHEGHDHAHDDHGGHDHGDHDHAHHSASEDGSFHLLGSTPKEWLQNASIIRYKRTNPRSLSTRHLAKVKKDVEEMLLRSYKMDPSHYGAYNSYHLFLTAHEFGGTELSRRHAKTIAEHTLQVISQEKEDPEAWLTAAAAATNLYFLESEDATETSGKLPAERLKIHRNRVAHCLSQFATLQEEAQKSGAWNAVPTKRQLEIESRSRFALKTFEQFGAMIARAEERSADDGQSTVIGGIEIP
ncbi:hypothetical protein VSU19_14330 [Verrucomicrobiales bacterium BCK34]|nr:hypothetical protein [Verrucomicrobiales bacterium BCK34]